MGLFDSSSKQSGWQKGTSLTDFLYYDPWSEQMGKSLQRGELMDAHALQSGKMQPWQSRNWLPITMGLRNQYDTGLANLTDRMKATGVTGPGAALALEKVGSGYGDTLANLSSQMKSGISDRATGLANMVYGQWAGAKPYKTTTESQYGSKASSSGSLFDNLMKMGQLAAPFVAGGLWGGGNTNPFGQGMSPGGFNQNLYDMVKSLGYNPWQ